MVTTQVVIDKMNLMMSTVIIEEVPEVQEVQQSPTEI
jgi:hypothetical protein